MQILKICTGNHHLLAHNGHAVCTYVSKCKQTMANLPVCIKLCVSSHVVTYIVQNVCMKLQAITCT